MTHTIQYKIDPIRKLDRKEDQDCMVSYEVERYTRSIFCLIFGDETQGQQSDEITKVNHYFLSLVIYYSLVRT